MKESIEQCKSRMGGEYERAESQYCFLLFAVKCRKEVLALNASK